MGGQLGRMKHSTGKPGCDVQHEDKCCCLCLSLRVFIYQGKERKGVLRNKGKRKSFSGRRMLQPLGELLSKII